MTDQARKVDEMLKQVNMTKLRSMELMSREVGRVISEAIEKTGERYGFALLMFSFNDPELTWISNAERPDMIKALKEFIARNEAGLDDELGRKERIKANGP